MPDPYTEREAEADRVKRMYDDVEDALIALLVTAFVSADPNEVAGAVATGQQMLTDAQQQTDLWHAEAIPALYGPAGPLSATSIPAITAMSEHRFADMTATVSRRLDDLEATFGVQASRWEMLAGFTDKRLAAGAGVPQIAADLRATLAEHGMTGFTDAAGRRWKLSTYADMAAHTTAMNAQNAGVADRVIQSGSDLVNVDGPLDYPDGCPPSVLGGPYSITGGTPDVMTLEHAIEVFGVFHPRCRHWLVPA